MKGYLSVSGGIIHLLIELALHTAPTKSLETKLLLSLTDNSLHTAVTHPLPASPSTPSRLPSPTHTPPCLCLSEIEHSLFTITLSHPSVYLFIHCEVLYPWGSHPSWAVAKILWNLDRSCQDGAWCRLDLMASIKKKKKKGRSSAFKRGRNNFSNRVTRSAGVHLSCSVFNTFN